MAPQLRRRCNCGRGARAAAWPWRLAALALALPGAAAVRSQQGLAGGPAVLAREAELPTPQSAAAVLEETPPSSWASRLGEDLLRKVLDHINFRHRIAVWQRRGPAVVSLLGGPQLSGGTAAVEGAAFFPYGDRVLTWGPAAGSRGSTAPGAVVVWDALTGAVQRTWMHDRPLAVARIYPQGDRVVACDAVGACTVWGADTGEPVFSIPSNEHLPSVGAKVGVEVFPSGDRLVLWGSCWPSGVSTKRFRDFGPAVRDASTGSLICEAAADSYAVTFAKIWPDGSRVLTGDSYDGVLLVVWDAGSCAELQKLVHAEPVMQVALLDGGRSVAALMWSSEVMVWDADSGERVHLTRLPSTWGSIGRCAHFIGDEVLATSGEEAITLWNTTSGRSLRSLEQPRASNFVASPAGDIIAACGAESPQEERSGEEERLTIWDARSGETLRVDDAAGGGARAECHFAIGLGAAADPLGFGRGVPWTELP